MAERLSSEEATEAARTALAMIGTRLDRDDEGLANLIVNCEHPTAVMQMLAKFGAFCLIANLGADAKRGLQEMMLVAADEDY